MLYARNMAIDHYSKVSCKYSMDTLLFVSELAIIRNRLVCKNTYRGKSIELGINYYVTANQDGFFCMTEQYCSVRVYRVLFLLYFRFHTHTNTKLVAPTDS